MRDNPQYFPAANWCDVFAHPEGWAFVRSEGSIIICVVNGAERWQVDVGEKVLYLRGISAPDGTVAAIMQGNDTGLCVCTIDGQKPVSLGPTGGQHCTAIAWEDGDFVAYILRSPTTFSRWPLGGSDVLSECVQTSQGWLDVVGGLQWTDANRDRTVNGITLALPFARGGVTVGQATTGSLEQVTAVLPDGQPSTVIRGTSYEPRVAVTADGVYAVCARTLRGAVLALCPPWPAYDTGVEVPAPPPPPPPPEPAEPLAVSVSVYTKEGTAPMPVSAFYDVTGHRGPVEVLLTIDGRIVGRSEQPAGRVDADTDLTEPGEYRLGVTVISLGRRAETGAVRIVRVLPRQDVPTPPPIPPEIPPVTESPEVLKRERAASAVRVAYRTLLRRDPDPEGEAHYLRCLMDGSMDIPAMEADMKASPEYAALPPAPAPGVAPVLSIRGRQFFDGDRLYVPRWVSGLTLLVKSPEQQAAYLDWAVRTGFNGVRVFAGALTWAGQTASGARLALPALIQATKERGLALEVTAITDSRDGGYSPSGHLEAVAAIVAGHRHVVLECANEIGHGSQDDSITIENVREWGKALIPGGVLWAVGATQTDEPHGGVYPAHGGSYSTAHLDRGRPTWNQVRRVREIYAIVEAHGAPAINNEPIGADEKHGGDTGNRQRWNDPAMFFALGALDRAFGVGGVHHSQAGLMAELPGPVQQQCADAYVAAHAAIDAVLPGTVGSYRNVGHGGSPLVDATFVEEDFEADGVVRAYSFISGDKGVTVLIGAKGNEGLQWGNGWRQVRVIESRIAQDGRSVSVVEIRR